MKAEDREPIKLIDVIVDEVGEPRGDRTRGTALYSVPFRLSRTPSPLWTKLFIEAWNRPPMFTSMHRPGIARISGERVILDGTTIEEVERYHLATLKLAMTQANQHLAALEKKSAEQQAAFRQKSDEHKKHVAEIASRLRFDP